MKNKKARPGQFGERIGIISACTETMLKKAIFQCVKLTLFAVWHIMYSV